MKTQDSEKEDPWGELYATIFDEAGREGVAPDPTDAYIDSLVSHFRVPAEQYEVGELLGSGGWKKVFSAFDTHSCREVAFAQPADCTSGEVIEAFLREARVTACLQHPNIIKLYNLGVSKNGEPFYTMEREFGGTLRELMERSPPESRLTEARVLAIFQQVCAAVAYTHSVGIAHLDLKPENIQVGPFGEVKVCDWGLAKTFGDIAKRLWGERITDICGDNGDLMVAGGTKGYRAPELRTKSGTEGSAVDIFALGKILQQLATKLPRSRCRRLRAVGEKASAEAPENRYSSVEEMLGDVENFDAELPTSVEPGGSLARIDLWIHRHQRKLLFAALAGITVVAIALLGYQKTQRAERDMETARWAEYEAREQQRVAEASFGSSEASRVVEAYNSSLPLLDFVVLDPDVSVVAVNQSIQQLGQVVDADLESGQENIARTQLGYALFLAQRFEECLQTYQASDADADLRHLAKNYRYSTSRGEVLPVDDFITLIRSLHPSRPALVGRW